jgi:hypothetical protein
MALKATALLIVALIAVVQACTNPALSGEYVVMLSRNINLRTGPGTETLIIGRAWKGDIFELLGETGNWYEVAMFSDDSRYVSKSWAAKLTDSQLVPGHCMTLPAADDTRRSLYRDINHAKERAAREADEIIPESVDEGCNRDLRNILEDRHILEVMAMYSAQPALYGRLVEAMTQNTSHAAALTVND